MRDLPTPGSPRSRTAAPRPAALEAHFSDSTSRSARRPTKGVSRPAVASRRLRTPVGRSTRNTSMGSAIPFRVARPKRGDQEESFHQGDGGGAGCHRPGLGDRSATGPPR